MAGSKTLFLSKAQLDHALGATIWTPPGTWYAALSLAAFDPTATGSAMSEFAFASYHRVAIANNGAQWPGATSAVPSVKANANAIVWPTPAEDWDVPLSLYLCDASINGNACYGCDITAADAITTGNAFKALAGTLIFSED